VEEVVGGGGLEDPGVLADPAEALGGVAVRGGVDAGECAGEEVEIGAGAQGEEDVVLRAFAFAAFVEAEGVCAVVAGLSDEEVWLFADFGEESGGGLGVAGLGVEGGDDGGEAELVEVIEDVFALVDVAEPEGGDGGEEWGFVEVEGDDFVAEGEEGLVVGDLGAECVDEGDGAFAQAVDEACDAVGGVAAEDEGIEEGVWDGVADDLDAFEAADGFEVDAAVEDEEVAAFDGGDAHAAGEKALFGGESAVGALGEEDDHGFALEGCGGLAQLFEHEEGGVREGLDGHFLKDLRDDAREGASVLEHGGDAAGVGEVLLADEEAAVGVAGEAEAAEVEVGAARAREADGGGLVMGAAEHEGCREGA